jgi:hypothetical protein
MCRQAESMNAAIGAILDGDKSENPCGINDFVKPTYQPAS